MPAPTRLAFDDVVLDLTGQRLLRGGVEQALEPKAFAVLALLAGSPGQVFGRDEILDAVWGHQHVTPGVLSRSVNLLRQALGEDAHHPRLLRTVHGVGYRFDPPSAAPGAEAATIDLPALDEPSIHSPPVAPAPQPGGRRWLWLAATAAIALPVAFAIAWLPQNPGEATQAKPPVVAETRPSIAVLPFVDLSPTRDQAYLGDGLAEEILNQLAQVPALRLVGRTSSFSFKGKNEDLRSIGRKLGVANLLEGSVRKDGDQLRISTQLVRTDDGTQLWAKTYARELRDVFALQDEIARDVAQALSVKLDAMTLNRAHGGTANIDAYDRYLRWRQLFFSDRSDAEHLRQCVRMAREAVALDPRFVLGLDALAISLRELADPMDDTQAGPLLAEAERLYARIAELAPDSWIVKRERAYGLWREGRRAEAIALAKEVMGNGPLIYERSFPYMSLIFAAGHLDETVALDEQLRVVEPLSMIVSRNLQFDYIAARRYPEAEAEYRRSLALEGSRFGPAYVAFMRTLAKEDTDPEKLRELYRQFQQHPAYDLPFFHSLGAVLHDRDAMLALLRKAAVDPIRGTSSACVSACSDPSLPLIQANLADALGDADLAAAALRKGLEDRKEFRDASLPYGAYFQLWISPYSSLRAHPGFKQLLIEMGLADYWRQTGKWGDGCEPVGADDFQCR